MENKKDKIKEEIEKPNYRNRRIIGIIGLFLTLTLGTFVLYKLGLIEKLVYSLKIIFEATR